MMCKGLDLQCLDVLMGEMSPPSPRQVNDTVLTDVQGQIGAASDISPPYPSQRSISLPTGNNARGMSQVGVDDELGAV